MQAALEQAFADRVGWQNLHTTSADMAPYLREWRGTFEGQAAAVVCPGSTQEVADLVRLCAEHNLAVVPQGGNTGLVGGAAPQSATQHILLSLKRLNTIREIDADSDAITVEAGCILSQIQSAAESAGRLFPLSLAAEGSCQIGGNLSTNAGGVNVLRYGNTRDLCLGLEVVLADGSLWNGLQALRKDNSGFDLKQLFIGAEGALGVITAATLKLFPTLQQRETAFVALPDPQSAIQLLGKLRQETGDNLIACELIPRLAVELTTEHIAGCRDPFTVAHPWYLLAEAASPAQGQWLQEAMQRVLAAALEADEINDAVLAASLQQGQDLWRIREHIPEAQVREGASIKHDVSVVVSRIPEFVAKASEAVLVALPGVRICAFGHVGDGNLHFNLSQPQGADAKDFMQNAAKLNQIVHDIVVSLEGSFAAEHGVGRLKTQELMHYKSDVAVTLMRGIKQALDPNNLMNPGVVLSTTDQ